MATRTKNIFSKWIQLASYNLYAAIEDMNSHVRLNEAHRTQEVFRRIQICSTIHEKLSIWCRIVDPLSIGIILDSFILWFWMRRRLTISGNQREISWFEIIITEFVITIILGSTVLLIAGRKMENPMIVTDCIRRSGTIIMWRYSNRFAHFFTTAATTASRSLLSHSFRISSPVHSVNGSRRSSKYYRRELSGCYGIDASAFHFLPEHVWALMQIKWIAQTANCVECWTFHSCNEFWVHFFLLLNRILVSILGIRKHFDILCKYSSHWHLPTPSSSSSFATLIFIIGSIVYLFVRMYAMHVCLFVLLIMSLGIFHAYDMAFGENAWRLT